MLFQCNPSVFHFFLFMPLVSGEVNPNSIMGSEVLSTGSAETTVLISFILLPGAREIGKSGERRKT